MTEKKISMWDALSPDYHKVDWDDDEKAGIVVELIQTWTPDHYKGSVQPIDLIEQVDPHFNQSQIIKYACRMERKGQKQSDLLKIIHYAGLELEKMIGESE